LNAPLEVTIDTATLSLGQVVPIPVTDPRSAVAMGSAPAPGLARKISRQEITARIQATGLPTDGLEFPEAILVRRRAAPLNSERTQQAVLAAFLRQFPNANVDLVSMEAPAIEVGTGALDISATLPPHFDPAQPVFVRVDIRGSGFARTLFVRTTVRIETIQPVIRTHVAANSELKASDVEWKSALMEGNGTVPASIEELAGMLTKRDLEPGDVVKSDLLYMPLYVRRGEMVTVRATSGSVTISATMRAMAAGHLGDTIPVQHLAGNGNTTARVVGPRTLEVLQR
jgi:flagella basal body P-ring formation protein FlgA